MRDFTPYERAFLEGLLKYSSRIIAGYYKFQPRNKIYGNTKYKRSRVCMQLHLNKWLDLDNLEVQMLGKHISNHHAGSIKFGNYSPSNKLTKDKINKIIQLSKTILKSNGLPNCEKIGRELNISGLTISRYLK